MNLLLFWSFKFFFLWSYNFLFFEKTTIWLKLCLEYTVTVLWCAWIEDREEEKLVNWGRAGHMEETQTALCPSQGAVLHETPATAACNNLLSLTSNDQCVEILQGFLPSAFIVLSNQLQSWPAAWAFPQAFLSSLGCCCLGLPPPIMPASRILLLLCPTAVAGLVPLSSPPKNILPQGMWFLFICLFSVCALCDPPSWREATGNKFCPHTPFDKCTVTSR